MKAKKQALISSGQRSALAMKDLPASERPYEKCMLQGAAALSDAELLAVMLRTGSPGEPVVDLCHRLIRHLPGQRLSGLFHVSREELQEIRGIGQVKAVQLLCLSELARRLFQSTMSLGELCCNEPEAVAAYYISQMKGLEKEEVRLLLLDAKNVCKYEMTLSMGSFNTSAASPREIFSYALQHKAIRILLVHNHPTGDPTPSTEDLKLTGRLIQVGKMVGIELLDHIIIGNNRYVSLRESDMF